MKVLSIIAALMFGGCETLSRLEMPRDASGSYCPADFDIYKPCMCQRFIADQNLTAWRDPYYECKGEPPWLVGGDG